MTRLNRGLGIDAVVVPVVVDADADRNGVPRHRVDRGRVARPRINMRRVATMMTVVDRARDGPLDVQTVKRGVAHAESEVGSGTAVFTLACATGAGALAVIFGATQPLVVLLAAVGAAAGGLLRRWLGIAGAGPLVQLFAAALLGGVLGALAAHLHLGGSTALVAICPAMVLVPGAHILNGALDLLDLRVTLGLARLGFAALLLTAISGGLMIGLALGGQTLAVTAPSSSAPFFVDVIAAGVAAASYPVVLLDAVADDRLAGRRRHVRARRALVGAGAWRKPGGRGLRCPACWSGRSWCRSRIACASRSPASASPPSSPWCLAYSCSARCLDSPSSPTPRHRRC